MALIVGCVNPTFPYDKVYSTWLPLALNITGFSVFESFMLTKGKRLTSSLVYGQLNFTPLSPKYIQGYNLFE